MYKLWNFRACMECEAWGGTGRRVYYGGRELRECLLFSADEEEEVMSAVTGIGRHLPLTVIGNRSAHSAGQNCLQSRT